MSCYVASLVYFYIKPCLPFNKHDSSVLYIAAAALSTLSLNPLVLMDGPVKASQDAGNRITANQILDQEWGGGGGM